MATPDVMAAALDRDSSGGSMIPASQRPDGTWRKPRRVKDGYVPQEEVPLYESKGRQFAAKRDAGVPVGLTAEIVAEARARRLQIAPTADTRKKKKKTPSVNEVAEAFAGVSLNPAAKKPQQPQQPDPAKRLKNLRKKLREIEILEAKLANGEIENPEKDQLEKVKNKQQVISEIAGLEAIV